MTEWSKPRPSNLELSALVELSIMTGSPPASPLAPLAFNALLVHSRVQAAVFPIESASTVASRAERDR